MTFAILRQTEKELKVAIGVNLVLNRHPEEFGDLLKFAALR